MATGSSNRDVSLTLSIETLGEENVKKLRTAVEQLAQEGGDAAPEFQRLADEIARLGQQNQALQTFKALSDETDKLSDKQGKAADALQEMSDKLVTLKATTAAAKTNQQQATEALTAGQKAYAAAGDAIRILKTEYDSAGKQTQEYRDELKQLTIAQADAKQEVIDLRAAQKVANSEFTVANDAQKKLQSAYDTSNGKVEQLTRTLGQQQRELQAAADSAQKLGVSTDNVAVAEATLVTALQRAAQEAAVVKGQMDILAQEEQSAAEGAKALAAALEQQKLDEAQQRTKALADQTALMAAEQDLAAQMAQQLADAQREAAAEADRLAQAQKDEFARKLTEAQKLLTAELDLQADIARDAASAQERLENSQKSAADAATKANQQLSQAAAESARRLNEAFSNLGIRSVQEVNREIAEVRTSMATLASSGTVTGTALSSAFVAGETRIKALQREVRELTGTLTLADKASSIFASSLSQIAVGNLAADAMGYLVNKVKEMGREFIVSITQLETFRRALNAIYKDSGTVSSQLTFLRNSARDAGVSVGSISDSFVKFSASMKFANVPLAESNALFAAVTRAAGTLGLSGERTTLMLDALAQMASKGVVSMEELRQQLGDSLPGALSLTAQGLGLTDAQLIKLVESGQLATRDFIPAFTRALGQLKGETEGIIPTWERFKNALTITAQNAGDSGWALVLNGALKALNAVVSQVAMAFTALNEAGFLATRSIAAMAAAITDGAPFWQTMREEAAAAKDRILGVRDAFTGAKTAGDAVVPTLSAATQAMVAQAIASGDLTRSQQAEAVAAKLAADATLDLGTKKVQLGALLGELIPAQEKETEALTKHAKAAEDQGKAMVELAKLRGDEVGVLNESVAAVEKQLRALEAVAASQREETRLQELQLSATLATATARKEDEQAIKAQTEKLSTKIQASKAEQAQIDAKVALMKQSLEQANLERKMYEDNSSKIKIYGEEVARLTAALKEQEKADQSIAAVAAVTNALRKQQAEATALYRDALNDAARARQAETSAVVAGLQVQQSELSTTVELLKKKADIARIRGENISALDYERRAQEAQNKIAEIKLKIDEVQAQLQIKLLNLKLEELSLQGQIDPLKRQEIELKIKLQEVTLEEVKAGRELLELKKQENTLLTDGLYKRKAEKDAIKDSNNAQRESASVMDSATSAMKRQNDVRENAIEQRERELDLAEREAELERKRLGVDKEGFSTDSSGGRLAMGGDLNTLTGIVNFLRSAGVDNEAVAKSIAREFADSYGNVQYFNNPGQIKYGGEGSTISYALLKAAEKYTFGGGKEAAERAKKVDAGSQTTSDTTGSSKAVNITINGKVRSINAASAADANALVALLRELESASNTSTT